MNVRRGVVVLESVVVILGALSCQPPEPNEDLYVTPEAAATLIRGNEFDEWNPVASPNPGLRGAVYDQVAPAVILVRTPYAHGTGFLVSKTGLVITAHHVIADAWLVDENKSASYVDVYLGDLEDGLMKFRDTSVPAYIVDVEKAHDLALLQLVDLPDESGELPTIRLADRRASPEDPCIMIGHPASGTLWSLRTGVVSGLGTSPRDLVRSLVFRLGLTEKEKNLFEDRIHAMGSQDIVLTNCGSSAGDSGGPLVNLEGRLIGVTCAVPADVAEQRFTYHVDARHVREILDKNNAPEISLYVPDAYRIIGPWYGLPQASVLTSGTTRGAKPNQYLLDLDGDTAPELIEKRDFILLIDDRRFDAEVAVHLLPGRNIAFYDTDNLEGMDDILVYEERSRAKLRFRFDPDEGWRLDDDLRVPWLDPSPLQKGKLRDSLVLNLKRTGLTHGSDG